MNVNYKVCEGSDRYLTVMKHDWNHVEGIVELRLHLYWSLMWLWQKRECFWVFFSDQLKTLECKMYRRVCLFFVFICINFAWILTTSYFCIAYWASILVSITDMVILQILAHSAKGPVLDAVCLSIHNSH